MKLNDFHVHNNKIRFGYLPKLDEYIPGGDFQVQVAPPERDLQSPIEEAIHAARLIEKARPKDQKLCLLMSGGIDSEAMCEAFLKADISDFEVCIFRFEGGDNDFDIQHAIDYCSKHDVPYSVIELPVYSFFESGEHEFYIHEYRCASPQLAWHLFAIDHIEGIPIFGGTPPAISYANYEKKDRLIIYPPRDIDFSYYRYFQKTNRMGIGSFFLYTPELIHSFLKLPAYEKYLDSEKSFIFDPTCQKDLYKFKCEVFREGQFEAKPKEAKYTGFEQFKERYHNVYLGGWHEPVFDNLYRYTNYLFLPPPKSETFQF